MKKQLVRGLDVTLPDGKPGVFLCFCRNSKLSWVLHGGADGRKRTDSTEEICKRTFGDG